MSENFVSLSGRAGKDPFIGTTQNNNARASFSLAVSKPPKDKGSDWITYWIPITGYGKTADKIRDYLRKGDFVKLTGELQTYRDKNDIDRFCVVVKWPEHIVIEPKAAQYSAGEGRETSGQDNGVQAGYSDNPDDLPF